MNRRLLQLVSLAAAVVLAGCGEDPISAPSPRATQPGAQPLLVAAPLFTYVSAAESHTCALRTDGVIECWGDNSFGQAPATKSASGEKFIWVSTGRLSDTCGVRSDGLVECWGRNIYGQAPASRVPGNRQPGFGGFFTVVSLGYSVACAVRSDGIIECWGGTGDSPQAPPVKKPLVGSFVDVSLGGGHACALRNDGAFECWGNNFDGQAPSEKIAAVGRYVSVQASDNHTCAMRSDFVIECWGRYSDATYPPATMVSTIPDLPFYNMTTGPSHVCGVRVGGVIECSGSNLSGQAPATKTAATSQFVGASAGTAHTCALRSDHVIECWGDNTNGQAPATRSALETRIKPTATLSAPASVIAGQSIPLTLTNATMPGYPPTTVFTFTYAFDCGTGFAAASAAASVNCPTTASGGALTVKGKVIDTDGDFTEYTKTVTVVPVSDVITQLKAEIATAPALTSNLRSPLTVKLNAALAALKKNQTAVACVALGDFRSQVTDKRGNGIPTATADAWLVTVATISSALGC